MARIRTIKPDFFTSEDIVSLSPLARLLYVGLWCEADREGRMTWRLGTLKLRYLPAETTPIEDIAGELINRGLVRLYGDGLACIPTFLDHQHLNPREAQSTLPAPELSTDTPRVSDASARVSDAQVGRKGKEGKEGNDASARVESKAVDKSKTAKPGNGSSATLHCSYCEKPWTSTANGLKACDEHFTYALDNERPGQPQPTHAREKAPPADIPKLDPDQGFPVKAKRGKFDDDADFDSQKLSDRPPGT